MHRSRCQSLTASEVSEVSEVAPVLYWHCDCEHHQVNDTDSNTQHHVVARGLISLECIHFTFCRQLSAAFPDMNHADMSSRQVQFENGL